MLMKQVGETKRERPEHPCWGLFDQEVQVVMQGRKSTFRNLSRRVREGDEDNENIQKFTPLVAAQCWYVADQWPKDWRDELVEQGLALEWNVAAALAPYEDRAEFLRQWSRLPEPRPCVEDFIDAMLAPKNGQHR
jgi:hypothetical protein